MTYLHIQKVITYPRGCGAPHPLTEVSRPRPPGMRCALSNQCVNPIMSISWCRRWPCMKCEYSPKVLLEKR